MKKNLPHHFAELLNFPKNIMECLESGFTVSIQGSRGHCIALDEAHEKCINKDLKGGLLIHIYTRRHYSFHTE